MYIYQPPNDIMEYLAEEKWYSAERSWRKLLIVARYIDDPSALKQLEEAWLKPNDRSY